MSTDDQKADLQLHALRQLAEHRGWRVLGEFVDQGVSGNKDRRPELDRLMKLAHQGKVDVVAVWKFDRFARSVKHLVTALDQFRAVGVDFVSTEDSIDTSTPAGRFVFHIFGAVAELERELIRERTIAGMAAARRRGTKVGRPRVFVDLVKARRLRHEGLPLKVIAKRLGVGFGTLHRALKRTDA